MKKVIGFLILMIVLVAVSGCTQQAKPAPVTTAIFPFRSFTCNLLSLSGALNPAAHQTPAGSWIFQPLIRSHAMKISSAKYVTKMNLR